jgi:hypothetical protein
MTEATELDEDGQREHLSRLYHELFEDDKRGQTVFEDLYRRFAAHAKVHTSGGIDAVLRTYQGAAHREVIEYIVTMVNRHKGVIDEPVDAPPTPPDQRML